MCIAPVWTVYFCSLACLLMLFLCVFFWFTMCIIVDWPVYCCWLAVCIFVCLAVCIVAVWPVYFCSFSVGIFVFLPV